MSGQSLIKEVQSYYTDFLVKDPADLAEIYSEDVVFCDPLRRVEGLPSLQAHFSDMSRGLTQCRFQFDKASIDRDSACLPWYMHYAHQSLRGGRPLRLRGCSLLRYSDKVFYHEDFFDLGAMVYEQVPLLGSLVRFIKARLGGR
ncbi:nuclear transport factor 2 family protein [Microbulbifer sp. 2205BS26-8]|uniref:nuclear transport factor 2 family protein n=1 Tax=Microbulbifer sp. 2205BS26-8 TaxID=3064386 RepID=UPI00273CF78C|nr:nuclear transport factor 2 family protein [Microbulbifer sp. 2205BS26-8]MDP5209017.1 nuclear transport factor 2 family protein [Microbulbifer sp. 2205BS26-8]